ncbi:hypothetical protein [Pyrodictium abyssi]|uniref:Uncharacterized protein n=1 Tax=Pyrodictium abyssi TaxID=54256 RepID=A0ABN6ZQR0_9CREN|nr:hypothetical protein PABY_21460 [Pyrodictium abyssi]
MQAPETLRELVARFTRLGFRVVFMDRAPLHARLYGGGWDTLVYEDQEGGMWQAMVRPAKRMVVIARLG